MAEPTNKYTNKKLEATETIRKELPFSSLNKKWGALGPESDDKKKSTANGLDPYQTADQNCEVMDLAKVDNNNKQAYNEANFPKKEAADKFKTGDLKNFDSLNTGKWGYTGPASDDKKKGTGDK